MNSGKEHVEIAQRIAAVNPFETISVVAPQLIRGRAAHADARVVRAEFSWASCLRRLGSVCLCHLLGEWSVCVVSATVLPAGLPCGSEADAPPAAMRQKGDESNPNRHGRLDRMRTNDTSTMTMTEHTCHGTTISTPTSADRCHLITHFRPAAFGAGGAVHACDLFAGGALSKTPRTLSRHSTTASIGFTEADGGAVSNGFTVADDRASRGFTPAGTLCAR